MQLGARWRAGSPPHRGAPPQLHALIASTESMHPEAGSWTLTWLEGRPRCSLDDLLVVTIDPSGEAVIESDAGGPGAGDPPDELDDDDDDWLR